MDERIELFDDWIELGPTVQHLQITSYFFLRVTRLTYIYCYSVYVGLPKACIALDVKFATGRQDRIVTNVMDKVLGLMNVMLWNVNVYSRFAISLNRFIAITLPLQSSTVLNMKNTSIVLLLCWLFGFCHITPYLWTISNESVLLEFTKLLWKISLNIYVSLTRFPSSWKFPEIFILNINVLPYCSLLEPCSYVPYLFNCLSQTSLTFLLNIPNRLVSKSSTLQLKTRTSLTQNSFYSYVAERRQFKMETRFFVQTLYENVLFFYVTTNFYYISTLFDNHWIVFFTSTFLWEICLGIDGKSSTLQLKTRTSLTQNSFYSYVAERRQFKMETRFFVQTLYENVLFFYVTTNFYYISTLFDNHWIVFFTSTFLWEICLGIDGFIVVLLHFRLSHLSIKILQNKSSLVHVITKNSKLKTNKEEK
ncbi:hypothetical protein DICVIV_11165 [Dictyocaulus viviparus]|uniref:7TM GPCR serpentine receptor class x (Srx) domain-containing protein n=1 Tax=Dictyocaulus viviparus TaxID=29172 RepID=A0A0D8XGG4_DICVI|nr:hypothetical protein DICVIV_11165 [Dictyocaulus viviparus]